MKSQKHTETAHLLKDTLGKISNLKELKIKFNERSERTETDISANFKLAGKPWRIVAEYSSQGFPRQIRIAILQLKNNLAPLSGTRKYGIIIAPFISEETSQICKDEGVGYMDLSGNYYLSFDQVVLERMGAKNLFQIRNEFRSVFSAKAERVLEVILRDPFKVWKVIELKENSGVSLGHVSNVRKLLVQHEWARIEESGVRLTQPEKLLDAWQKVYKPKIRESKMLYTLLIGEELENAIKTA